MIPGISLFSYILQNDFRVRRSSHFFSGTFDRSDFRVHISRHISRPFERNNNLSGIQSSGADFSPARHVKGSLVSYSVFLREFSCSVDNTAIEIMMLRGGLVKFKTTSLLICQGPDAML